MFDLGETLIQFGRLPVHDIFVRAARLSYNYLVASGQPVGSFRFYRLWNNLNIRLRLLISFLTGNDFDSLTALKQYGRKRGFNLTDSQWEELNWQWYSPLVEKAQIEPDLKDTLTKLRQTGLKLGILSNTFVHGSSLDRHLQQAGVLDFFDPRIYSYQFSFRKPDPRIFLEAARRIDTDPARILYVGDRLDKDVRGARSAGMTPILKSAYTNRKKNVPDGIFRVQYIAELPELIRKLNQET